MELMRVPLLILMIPFHYLGYTIFQLYNIY